MADADILEYIPYESRNLNIPAFTPTLTFLKNPNSVDLEFVIKEKIEESGNIFIQSRIPKESIHIAIIMQDLGFYFVESTLVPQAHLSKNIALKKFTETPDFFIPLRYSYEQLEVHPVDKRDSDVRRVIEEIAKNSFVDDRFHLDPNCPCDIADSRFVKWLQDLYSEQEVVIYTLKYDDVPIGFMCRKDTKLILAGLSKRYRNSGLGDFLWLSVMKDMLNQSLKKVSTLISTNNTSVLNLYARLRFQFKHPETTFHYWNK